MPRKQWDMIPVESLNYQTRRASRERHARWRDQGMLPRRRCLGQVPSSFDELDTCGKLV